MATPDPAPRPSDLVLAAIVALTARRVFAPGRESAAQTSTRAWPAQTPASSRETAVWGHPLTGGRQAQCAEARPAGVPHDTGANAERCLPLRGERERHGNEQRRKRNRSHAHGTGKIQRGGKVSGSRVGGGCCLGPARPDPRGPAGVNSRTASPELLALPDPRPDAVSRVWRSSPGPACPRLPAGCLARPLHQLHASRGVPSRPLLSPWRYRTRGSSESFPTSRVPPSVPGRVPAEVRAPE